MEEITPLRKLQLAELEVLKEIVRICENENIHYYLMGGTFLGAVRHKGFIPWDDDIDIGMPRDDYERFLEIVQIKINKEEYELQTYKNNKEYNYYPARIIDKRIKILNESAKNKQIVYAWVDIFPLDGMPSNVIISKIHQFRLLFRRAMSKFACFDDVVNLKDVNRPLIEKILIWFGMHFKFLKKINKLKQFNKIDKLLKKYPINKSKYYVNFMGAYRFKEMFKKEIYGNTAKYDFETEKLVAPSNYHKVLSQMYGDYMKIPSEHQRNKHNTKIIEEEDKK